jgi:hypothetical protein
MGPIERAIDNIQICDNYNYEALMLSDYCIMRIIILIMQYQIAIATNCQALHCHEDKFYSRC